MFSAIESEAVHPNDVPTGITLQVSLPGTVTIDRSTNPLLLTTTDDLRRKVAPGASVTIDDETRVVASVTKTEITITTEFKTATNGPNLVVKRPRNTRRVVVEIERTRGSSGRVAVDLRTCQAGHLSKSCGGGDTSRGGGYPSISSSSSTIV